MLLTLALEETRARAHLCPYIHAEQLIPSDNDHIGIPPITASPRGWWDEESIGWLPH